MLPFLFSFLYRWPCLEVTHIVNLQREICSEHELTLFSLEMLQDGLSDVHHEEGFNVVIPIIVGIEDSFVALIDYIFREVEEFLVYGIAEMIFSDDGKVALLVRFFLVLEDGGPDLIDAFDVLFSGEVLVESEVTQCSIADEFDQAFSGEDDVFEDEKGKCVAHQFFSFGALDDHWKVMVQEH